MYLLRFIFVFIEVKYQRGGEVIEKSNNRDK